MNFSLPGVGNEMALITDVVWIHPNIRLLSVRGGGRGRDGITAFRVQNMPRVTDIPVRLLIAGSSCSVPMFRSSGKAARLGTELPGRLERVGRQGVIGGGGSAVFPGFSAVSRSGAQLVSIHRSRHVAAIQAHSTVIAGENSIECLGRKCSILTRIFQCHRCLCPAPNSTR